MVLYSDSRVLAPPGGFVLRPLQPRRVARTAAVALAATVAFSLAPAPPVQGSVQSPQTRGRQTRSWQLAPGLVLKRVQYSDGPVEVRALIVNPRKVSASKDPSRAMDPCSQRP